MAARTPGSHTIAAIVDAASALALDARREHARLTAIREQAELLLAQAEPGSPLSGGVVSLLGTLAAAAHDAAARQRTIASLLDHTGALIESTGR